MSKISSSESYGVMNGVKRVASVAILALAGVGAYNIFQKFNSGNNFNSGISSIPNAEVSIQPNTIVTTSTPLECTSSTSQNIYISSNMQSLMGLGGFAINQTYPVNYLDCSPNSSVITDVTKTSTGIIKSVSVNLPPQAPYNTGIDFNNGPVICGDIPQGASAQEIKKITNNYYNAIRVNGEANCTFGQETTGLGSTAAAAALMNFSVAQIAVDSAILTPLNQKQENILNADEEAALLGNLKNEFPKNIPVTINKSAPIKPTAEVLNSLVTNAKTLKGSIKKLGWFILKGRYYLSITSDYGGAKATVEMPKGAKLNVGELNREAVKLGV